MKPSSDEPRLQRLRRRPLGGYRYVRLRWRLLFAVVDALGYAVFGLARRLRRLWNSPLLPGEGQGVRAARPPSPPTGNRITDSPHPNPLPEGEGTGITPRRILLVQLDHLGDAVITLAILPALRRAWPGARLEVLASPANAELFAAAPEVDEVHVCRVNRFARSHGQRFGWLAAIAWWGWHFRREGVDLAIDVRGDFPVAWLLWLSGAPRRLGWACGGGGFFLTHVAQYVPNRPEVQSRWALLAALGVSPAPGERRCPAVQVSDSARARVAGMLEQHSLPGDLRPLVAVHLGAGTPAKRWPAEHWAALVEWLHARAGARVVLIGTQADRPLAETLAAGQPADRVWDATGRCTLEQLGALLQRACLLVGADSGPAHLAAAVGTPVVALFSGTNDPRQWRPAGARVLVLRCPVACTPCHRQACPVAGHPCMRGLTPQAVIDAVRPWLPEPAPWAGLPTNCGVAQ